jgi:hypothetical protein
LAVVLVGSGCTTSGGSGGGPSVPLTLSVTSPAPWPGTVTVTPSGSPTLCTLSLAQPSSTCTVNISAGSVVMVGVDSARALDEPSLPPICGVGGCVAARTVERLHADWSAPCANQSTSCVFVLNGATNLNIALSRFAALSSFHSSAGSTDYCGESVNTCVHTSWDVTLSSLLSTTSGPLRTTVGMFVDSNPSTISSTVTPSAGTVDSRVSTQDFVTGLGWSGETYNLSGPAFTLGSGQSYSFSVTGFQRCHAGFVQLSEESGSGVLQLFFDATSPQSCDLP